jgi:hypothetical protein
VIGWKKGDAELLPALFGGIARLGAPTDQDVEEKHKNRGVL